MCKYPLLGSKRAKLVWRWNDVEGVHKDLRMLDNDNEITVDYISDKNICETEIK